MEQEKKNTRLTKDQIIQYQYGAEAFEAYMKTAKPEATAVQETKTPEVKSMSR